MAGFSQSDASIHQGAAAAGIHRRQPSTRVARDHPPRYQDVVANPLPCAGASSVRSPDFEIAPKAAAFFIALKMVALPLPRPAIRRVPNPVPRSTTQGRDGGIGRAAGDGKPTDPNGTSTHTTRAYPRRE